MAGFGEIMKGIGKRAGGAIMQAGETYSKGTSGDEGAEPGASTGRKIGRKVGGYLRKKIKPPKAGPKQPTLQKGIF